MSKESDECPDKVTEIIHYIDEILDSDEDEKINALLNSFGAEGVFLFLHQKCINLMLIDPFG